MESEKNGRLKFRGSIAIIIISTWFIMLIIILGSAVLEMYITSIKAEIIQDDLVYSNLSIYKNLDLRALGDIPLEVRVSDTEEALATFKNYLAQNMKLSNQTLIANSNSIVVGQVVIEEFCIFNIHNNAAEIFDYNKGTNTFTRTTRDDISTNPVITPNNIIIENTAIYTRISFNINPLMRGILGDTKKLEARAVTDLLMK